MSNDDVFSACVVLLSRGVVPPSVAWTGVRVSGRNSSVQVTSSSTEARHSIGMQRRVKHISANVTINFGSVRSRHGKCLV